MVAYGSHSTSSEMRVRMPRPDGGCHQCWTSPSVNCRAGSAQEVLARHLALRDRQRHDVLELIAEPVGAAWLVERRARPDAARERLIQEPAVEEHVHRPVGGRHLYGAQDVVPPRRDGVQDGVEVGRSVAGHERPRLRDAGGLAEESTTTRPASRAQLDRLVERTARVEPGSDLAGERGVAREGGGAIERAVAAEELGAVAGPAQFGAHRDRRTPHGPRTRRSTGSSPAGRRCRGRSR